MPAIVVPDDSPAVLAPSAAFPRLKDIGEVRYFDSLPGSEEKLIERLGRAEIVVNIRSSSRFTAGVFEAVPSMRMLSLWGTGTDNVDLAAAARHGVAVTNTPGVSAPAIAEHSLALMLAAARKIPQLDADVRDGAWPRGSVTLMAGKTLGIIGLGAIGRRFAQIGAGIGMRVIAWTMHPNPALGFELVPLDTLLRDSDVVSLHLRLSDQTRGFLSRDRLALLKPTTIFVNTARGPIVDEAALVDALRGRRIAAAGLDVFDQEPLPQGHPLTALDNVVLTPHSAGICVEALEAGLALAVDNVKNFLSGQPTNVVTLPKE